MTDAKKETGPTNIKLIREFFFSSGPGASKALQEIKALTSADKTQLGEGIRNGSLTY
jgi:hypothetical protein